MNRKEIWKERLQKVQKVFRVAVAMVLLFCVFYTVQDVYAQTQGEGETVISFAQLKQSIGTISIDVANEGDADGSTDIEVLVALVSSISEDLDTGMLTIKLAGVVPQYPFP